MPPKQLQSQKQSVIIQLHGLVKKKKRKRRGKGKASAGSTRGSYYHPPRPASSGPQPPQVIYSPSASNQTENLIHQLSGVSNRVRIMESKAEHATGRLGGNPLVNRVLNPEPSAPSPLATETTPMRRNNITVDEAAKLYVLPPELTPKKSMQTATESTPMRRSPANDVRAPRKPRVNRTLNNPEGTVEGRAAHDALTPKQRKELKEKQRAGVALADLPPVSATGMEDFVEGIPIRGLNLPRGVKEMLPHAESQPNPNF